MFLWFLRSGDITVPSDQGYDNGPHLSYRDISVDSVEVTQVLKVQLKASKTDPFRIGVDIFWGERIMVCPISAVLAYLGACGPDPGLIFVFENSRPLTRTWFVQHVKQTLTLAVVDSSLYTGHSFRIGAATTATQCGVNNVVIKMLGRWQSSAYQTYIRTPRNQLAAISSILCRGVPISISSPQLF